MVKGQCHFIPTTPAGDGLAQGVEGCLRTNHFQE